jgi:hypothetical protein
MHRVGVTDEEYAGSGSGAFSPTPDIRPARQKITFHDLVDTHPFKLIVKYMSKAGLITGDTRRLNCPAKKIDGFILIESRFQPFDE